MDLTSDKSVTIRERTVCEKCGLAEGAQSSATLQGRHKTTTHHEPVKEKPRISKRERPAQPTKMLPLLIAGAITLAIILTVLFSRSALPSDAQPVSLVAATKGDASKNALKKNDEINNANQANTVQEGIREVNALEAWRRAEEQFEKQHWTEAKSAYEGFQRDFDRTAVFKRQSSQFSARLSAANAALSPVFVLPKDWKGTAENSAQGNPFLVGDTPMWRLDQIWPDDPLNVLNYKRLCWVKGSWQSLEHAHGGQPSAGLQGPDLQISNRTWWPGEEKNKLAALSFIAPAKGRYELKTDVKPTIFDGGAAIELMVFKRDGGRIERIAVIALENKKAKNATVTAELSAGAELTLLPAFQGTGHCAANFLFSKLKITFEPK